MTNIEQEKLFKRVRERFPNHSVKWCSGYVHGIVDEVLQVHPTQTRVEDNYYYGYIAGFIDARGVDIYTTAPWTTAFTRPDSEFHWWKN